MISHELKCILITVRRAAGTSLKNCLLEYCKTIGEDLEPDEKKHFLEGGVLSDSKEWGNYYEEIDKYRNKGYKVVTICRNPYDKLISGASYLNWGKYYLGKRCLSLEHFLNNLPEKEKNYNAWFHVTRTMTEMLIDKNNKYIADFTIRFENLNEDFAKLCAMLGVEKISLPHRSKTKHLHYSAYYNQKTRKMVEKHFGRDIEFFKYRFEDKASLSDKITAKSRLAIKSYLSNLKHIATGAHPGL